MGITGKDSLFEASAGVLLTAHTPSGSGAMGGTWVEGTTAVYTPSVSLAGGGFVPQSAAAPNNYLDSSLSADPDYVECNLNFSVDGYGAVALYADGLGSGHGYHFYRYPGGWKLYADGGATLLGSSSASFATGTDYLMRLERSGGMLACKLNGTQIMLVSDSTYTGPLYGGIAGYDVGPTFSLFETGTIGVGPPTAGTLTVGLVTVSSVALAFATNSGGTPSYSNQLQRSPHGAGTWSNIGSPVSGATASFTDSTVSAGTSYDYRVIVTDSISNSATSNTITVMVIDFAAINSSIVYNGRWATENTVERWTINNGCICEFVVSGSSSITLYFDTSNCVNYPAIAYSVDGVGWTRVTLDASGTVLLSLPGSPYNAVSYNVHRVRFITNIDSEYPSGHNNWTDQRDALRFLGILAPSGTLLDLPTNPNKIEFLGDSIAAGLRMLYVSTDGVSFAAPEIGWPICVADLLGLKPIVNGHGGQGITTTGSDGAPVANSAFGFVYNGRAWSPTIQPVVVVVYEGTNDSSFTSGQYQTYLTTIRTLYPNAYIFAITPDGKSSLASAISGAVTAMADARIFYRDYSGLSLATTDGLHPSIGGSNKLAPWLATDIQSQLNTLGVKFQASGGGVANYGF